MLTHKQIHTFQFILLAFIVIGYQLLGDSFQLVPSNIVIPFYRQLEQVLMSLRTKLLGSLEYSLPSPHAGFVEGVILGAMENIPKATVEVFRKTGASHMVAVSGYNVTVVSNFFSKFFVIIGFSRYKTYWLVTTALIAFAILTGAGASVVRAAIMSIIFLTAKHIGRPGNITTSIIWAALIMLIFNPSLYKNDLGFQLSFMSTLGLVYFSQYFSDKLPANLPGFLKDGLASTFSATLLTLPIIIYSFGRISLASLPANVLTLPLMPYLMMSGSLTMFVGLASSSLGKIVGIPAHLISAYIIGTLNFFAQLDYSELRASQDQPSVLYVYAAIFIFYRLYVFQPKSRASSQPVL